MNPDGIKALVRVAYGAHGVVQPESGDPVHCHFRRRVGRPCCGDRVIIRSVDDTSWAAEEILPRRNRFVRADARGRKQTVAANLDRVLVVIATSPLPSQDLLDRYLVAVHTLGMEPVIVVNKVELPIDESHNGAATLQRLVAYEELGYAVVKTSCKTKPGVQSLRPLLAEGSSILVGQSGVGKSSLVRQLLPDLEIQTGALSRVTGKGTHTTTTTTLYDLPEGSHLIDSPGVWEYGLWSLEDLDLQKGYPEIARHADGCRFNDCLHKSEPGCAVKVAVSESNVPQWRYQSYLRLLEQNRT